MDIPRGKLDMNRIPQCVHHYVNLGITTASSDSNALILPESLVISVDFRISLWAIRFSLFLHLHLLCGL